MSLKPGLVAIMAFEFKFVQNRLAVIGVAAVALDQQLNELKSSENLEFRDG